MSKMHSNFLIIIWRRKLSILLITSSLILLTLWSWALLSPAYSTDNKEKLILIKDSNNHEYLIQKLITQANRVLRRQRSHPQQDTASEFAAQQSSQPTRNKNSVKFVKPTSSTSSLSLSSALSLTERQKKAAANGVQPLESYLFEEERLRILQNQQKGPNNDDTVMDYERILSSAERQSQYEHELQRIGVPVIAGIGPGGPRPPNERLVHLDLKGAPPKLSFLKRILPIIKTLGATGLLIEYEDMFPYSGSLAALAATNAYKADELRDFLEAVAMTGLSVMPLVQTFGHLEFALKLQGFEHMRELPESPQSLCPSQRISLSFIEDMLTQIVEFHMKIGQHYYNRTDAAAGDGGARDEVPPNFTHIHIGCDEVFRMGECVKCRLKSHNELFLTHVTTIASYVRAKWPRLKVVIWDDMLRDMALSEMQNSQIGSYVEPMIWVYAEDIYRFIQPQLWDMYAKVFPTAWAASAFKGAFGESLMIPPMQRHLENNIRWLAVIAKEGGRFSKGFKGLALTGWQRYDHFATLCELFTTGMPSLITTLSTVSKGFFSVDPKDNDILKVMECAFRSDSRHSGHPWLEIQPNSHRSQLFLTCVYPGSVAYKYALRLFEKLAEVQNYLLQVSDKSAWMSDYNVRHNFSSPLRVRDLTMNTPGLIDELSAMSREAHSVMHDDFDESTIAEFIEQTIYPVIVSLQNQISSGHQLAQTRTWPRRPLPYARQLIELRLIPDPNSVNN